MEFGKRCGSMEGTSVVTRRNFGLLRGKSLHQAPKALLKITDDISSSGWSSNSSSSCSSQSSEHGFGNCHESIGCHVTNLWEWPLGEPKIVDDRCCFEVEMNIRPFKEDQVRVTVMGNELLIHCDADSRPLEGGWLGKREISRCYALPVNVNPKTAQFYMTSDGRMRLRISKDLPLELAIAYFVTPMTCEQQ